MPLENKFHLFALLLIVTLCFAAYSNAFNGEFIWDDNYLIKNNVYIRSFSKLPNYFSKNLMAGAGADTHYWRPMQLITYAVDYKLWGFNPRGYHFSNILLHALAGICFYFFLFYLFKDKILALISSSLFVVHPIHNAAATYISGRADPLSLIFILVAFIFYHKSFLSDKKYYIFLVLSFFTFALLSKEYALIFPFLLLLYHWFLKKPVNKTYLGLVFIFSLSYVFLRLNVLSDILHNAPEVKTSFLERIPGFFVAFFNYIKLLFLPFNLHMEYGKKVFSFLNLEAVLGVLFFVALIAILKKRKGNMLISFSIMWFLASLIPVSNLYPTGAYMAEHWLYFPSLGFFLILGYGINSLYNDKKKKIFSCFLFLFLLVFFGILNLQQNHYWDNTVNFYERTLKHNPESARIHDNLGLAYKNQKRYKEAIEQFLKALEINPEYTKAYNNLGLTYSEMEEFDQAINYYNKAIEAKPDSPVAYSNLGNVYQETGDKDKALELYEKALELGPDYYKGYNNKGIVYSEMGSLEKAIAFFKKAISINPYYSKPYVNLGNIHKELGQTKEAIFYYQKAIELYPDQVDARSNLAAIYNEKGEFDKALELLQKAITIDKDNADAYYNLGKTFMGFKMFDHCLAAYRKAIECDPQHADAFNNLGNIYGVMGETDQAIEFYYKALELRPDDATVYNNLAAAFFYKNDFEKAIEFSEKAKDLGFDNRQLDEALTPYKNRDDN